MAELIPATSNFLAACPAEDEFSLPDPSSARFSGLIGAERWLRRRHKHDARSIDYCLYIPPGEMRTGKRPLVVMLHGCGQDAQDFADGTRMNDLARDAGAMVVYPEQTQHANSQNCWNWFKTQHQRRGRGEPELLVSLVKAVIAKQDVDPARVYLAGLSSGGAMAAILARVYPEVFAAVGIHSGVPAGVAQDLTSGLAVMRHGLPSGINAAGAPVPMIVFQGEADEVVHRDNARALVESACKALGITEAPEVHSGRGANFRSFRRWRYRLAGGVALVEHWQLTGAGHTWSGGHAAASYTSPGGPSASAEMLRFFQAHRSGQARH